MSRAQTHRNCKFRFGRYVTGCLVIGLAVACDALWVEDTPRPTLGENDDFSVSPACPTLAIDSNAIAGVEPTIAITARRERTHLGAEGVPVDVTIGPCGCAESGPGSDASVDAGAATALDGGSRCAAAALCTAGLDRMDSARVAGFELVATRGCEQVSPTGLNCTLDPSGQATFRVRSLNASAPALLLEYLPICVRPKGAPRDTEVRVVPREGTAHFAAAVAAISDVPSPGPDGGSCESLSDCTTKVPRARFSAGVIGADTPARTVREDDFLHLQRDVVVSVTLSPPSSEAFLTTASTCTDADGGPTGSTALNVPIARGQRGTVPFVLCGLPTSGSFQLAARLFAPNADGGAPIETGGVESRSLDVAPAALVKAYGVGSDAVLSATTCDGTTSPARASEFQSISSEHTIEKDTIVVSCRVDGGSPDGGAPCSVNLTLAAGGTCAL